jgi:hypothetical protein
MRRTIYALFLLGLSCLSANAGEYLRIGFFEFPDPTTAPRVTARCVKMGSMDVPCPTWDKPLRTCRKETCIGHAYTTELLRTKVEFVAYGPDAADEAVRFAVRAVITNCGVKGANAGKTAAAALPSPEPAARIAAGLAAAVAVFKACIATASMSAVVAGIVNRVDYKIEQTGHWARI